MHEVNRDNHAITQARNVYGVELSVFDVDIIKQKIRQGYAKFAAFSMNDGANFYLYTWDGVEMKFLYNEKDDVLITVVPLQFRTQRTKQKNAQRKKEFFRHFEDDGEEEQ